MNRTLAAVAIGLVSVAGGCQSQYAVEKPETRIDRSRVEVRNQRRQVFDEALHLSEVDAKAFSPIYDDYDAEWRKLCDQRFRLLQEYTKLNNNTPNDVARDLTRQALDLDARGVDLRTRYAKRFETATSAVVAGRFVQTDVRLQLAVDAELLSVLPPLPRPQR